MSKGRNEELQFHDRQLRIAQIENIFSKHGFYEYLVEKY